MLVLKSTELVFAKVKPEAKIPSKRMEDGAYDVYACFEEDYIVIRPHETKLIPTGIATAFTPDYVAIVKERGSTGTKGMGQRAGVIDSGYRGEWFLPITNHNDYTLVIAKDEDQFLHGEPGWVEAEYGDEEYLERGFELYPYEKAIGQFIMVEVPRLTTKEISFEELQAIPSERGAGALGSSGK